MDWTGNKNSTFKTLGASNHVEHERAQHDYYATCPSAVERLLEVETFDKNVWECACGGGHIARVLRDKGYNVYCSDKYCYDYPADQKDFLTCYEQHGDIITNPPYKYALDFVKHAIKVGNKVAMLLRIQFLEGIERGKFFAKFPPCRVLVFSKRIKCAMNGDFDSTGSSAVCYAWFIWEQHHSGDTVVKWI